MTSYVDEMRRALDARIDGLDEEISTLLARHYYVPVGDPSYQRNLSAKELLDDFATLPDILREELKRRDGRKSRAESRALNLSHLVKATVDTSALVQAWFGGSHGEGIPVALDVEVRSQLELLELSERRVFMTASPADELATMPGDSLAAIFRLFPWQAKIDVESETEDADSESGYANINSTAVVRVPTYEASSPRWWPIILGHELAHTKISADNAAGIVPDRNSTHHPALQDTDPSMLAILARLQILETFPFDRIGELLSYEPSRVFDEMPGIKENPRQIDLLTPIAARAVVANNWVTECLCDLAMVRQFGPAGLLAMGNYLTAVGNFMLTSESHPPAWFRIKLMLRYLDSSDAPNIQLLLDTSDSDRPVDDDLASVTAMYDFIDANYDRLATEVDTWPGDPFDLDDPLREASVTLALRQLALGLPPFDARLKDFPAVGDHGDTVTAGADALIDETVSLTVSDVCNAAWLATRLQITGPSRVHPKIPIDRLALKSVENYQVSRLAKTPSAFPPSDAVTVPAGGGGILGADAITARLNEPDVWRRIVLTPRFDESVTTPSIDLRLGTRFIVFQRSGIPSFTADQEMDPKTLQRSIERSFGQPFVLHPGEVVLASALEYVALPADVGAQVITRSSYGRLGLITATAVQVHPLYRGCLTLELVNLGTVPLELFPGERVAQLVFFGVDASVQELTPDLEHVFGRTYSCPTSPEFPKIRADKWVRLHR